MKTFNSMFIPVLGDMHQDLEAHREQPPHQGPHARAFAVEAQEKVPKPKLQRTEAAHVARLVREMLDGRVTVYDDDTGIHRPVRPGDVALLSRVWAPSKSMGRRSPRQACRRCTPAAATSWRPARRRTGWHS